MTIPPRRPFPKWPRTPHDSQRRHHLIASEIARQLASFSSEDSLEHSVTDPDLVHFVDAQTQIYGRVVEELTDGRKRTHWMWFIFPQLTGLGHSTLAQRYAIRDIEQARRYLADPMLGSRLRDGVRLMIGHKGRSALEILGSPDDLKLRSSLTLFAKAASDNSDRMLFQEALDQFYSGLPDPRTLELLGSSARNMQS
jgi:uncharacterized protein (DUF1810 family)